MDLHINIVGIMLISLALFHITFPKFFNWKKELESMTLINRQIMKVHTFFIALTVFLIGLLCITNTKELIETNLGKNLSFGLGIFWTIRLVFQFFVYSQKLWKGKTFETSVHIFFSIFWAYISIIFWLICLK